MLLAALCGEHLLLLGPPGTAKSELSRRLAGITGGAYYERLLTRFSVPEELFGPLSMRGGSLWTPLSRHIVWIPYQLVFERRSPTRLQVRFANYSASMLIC